MYENNLRKSIMRRVYAVWALRKLTSPFFVKGYIFALLFYLMASEVSFVNVLTNAPGASDLFKNVKFFSNAVAMSEPIVQVYTILSVLIMALLARDVLAGRKSATRIRVSMPT